MRVLLVQDNADLGAIWVRFFQRNGIDALLATSQVSAINALDSEPFDALVLEPMLRGGGGIAVADFATFRNPDIAIIAVTASSFFSDGLVFDLIPNARALMRTPLRPGDLLAFVEHCAQKAVAGSGQASLMR